MVFELKEKDVLVIYYYVGMEGGERIRNVSLWFEDKVNVICCINVFGMGIDKKGVRFVIYLIFLFLLEDYI